MSYRGGNYTSPSYYGGSCYSSYKNKVPTTPRTSSIGSNNFRSVFSPPSAGVTTSTSNNNGNSSRYGTGNSRTTFGGSTDDNNKRTTDSSAAKIYQTAREKINNPATVQPVSEPTSKSSSRFGGSSPDKPTNKSGTAYAINRSNLYKLPVSPATPNNGWSSGYGSSTANKSSSGRTENGTENNLSVSSTPYFGRSLSNKSETDSGSREAPTTPTSSSALPRSLRAYNQRSSTTTTFQSPSTYTPRTYGRTASRDLSYASSLANRPLETRPLRTLVYQSNPVETKPVPEIKETIQIKENTSEPDESDSSEESSSTDSDDEGEEADPGQQVEVVISRGTSPTPPGSTTANGSSSIATFISTPKSRSSCIQQPKLTHEVQTEEPDVNSNRPRRFLGYTGSSIGSSASPRIGSYADRYFSTNIAPSRYSSAGRQAAAEAEKKDKSPPTASMSKPPIIPAGIGSKEYRKSALNVDLDDQQVSEFRKRQEEFREAQRKSKRQARKSSGSSSPAGSGSRRNSTVSLASSENNTKSKSPVSKIQRNSIQTSDSRKKVSVSPSPPATNIKISSSSRSSSCSSSSSSDPVVPVAPSQPEVSHKVKSRGSSNSLSSSNSKLPIQPSPSPTGRRKNGSFSSADSASSNNHRMLRIPSTATSPRISPVPSRSPVKSPSPSGSIQGGARSSSRSPSVNWSALLNMTRGLDGGEIRSSTSPESLPSKSSSAGSSHRRKALIRSPLETNNSHMSRSPSSNLSRTQSRSALKQAASSGSLPPRSAAASRSHIPSRNASIRSIPRSCSSSTDSSSTESSERAGPIHQSASGISIKHDSLEVVNPASGGGGESTFAATLASSFGWLRKQNSEIMPWWLPSSDNIPAKAEDEDEGNKAGQPDEETSTSSADETQSSSSTEEGDSSDSCPKPNSQHQQQVEQADTDVEVEELPADQGNKLAPIELGDRSSPDGFEWPVCPSPPPTIRRNGYPIYRPPSPYDNVVEVPSGTVNTPWGLEALRALESSAEVSQPHPASPKQDGDFAISDESSSQQEEEEEEEVADGHDQEQQQQETKTVPGGGGSSSSSNGGVPGATNQLEDATFQLYKDGDYGNYLDVEASINEQAEELEGFLENRKNSIVLRTQLSVRVHSIMDKLLHSEGRELRRALFSLKQIFQEDKDLVHEFVQNDGLACLVRVGLGADQNYQNYILRALGQVMLYVDGMNGVMEHNPTVQWLYSLITSKYRLVAKTALKLLLVFVEYVKSNCQLLIKAIETVDVGQGHSETSKPWSSVIRLLQERDSSDPELLIYAVTLINKTLQGLSDQQDSYYDQIEYLEAQGMQQIVSRFMSRPGTDTELLQQMEIYELQLKEDEDSSPFVSSNYSKQQRRRTHWRSTPRPSSQSNQQANKRLNSFQLLKTITGEPEENGGASSAEEQQTSRKQLIVASQSKKHLALLANELAADKSFNQWSDSSSSSESSSPLEEVKLHMLNGSQTQQQGSTEQVGVTPALRRRREKAERQRALLRDQEGEATARALSPLQPVEDVGNDLLIDENRRNAERTMGNMPPISERISNLQKEKDKDNGDRNLFDISREASVRDLTERLQANHISANNPTSPTEDKLVRLGDLSGIISKAKEELIKSKSRHDLRNLGDQQNSSSISGSVKVEPKKSENELHWESLLETLDRPLQVCDLDFTDLQADEDSDPLNPVMSNGFGPPPPPPPPCGNGGPLPPPPMMAPPPMPPSKQTQHPSSVFGVQLHHSKGQQQSAVPPATDPLLKKSKKTVKLFWREIRDDQLTLTKGPTLWDELKPVSIDTQKLEHLFESRSKDLMTKEKQHEAIKNKELIVLDPKRSNTINIGMTKLPPSRTIKTAILKMDSTIINREGIEKLLTMLPTEEERVKIQEAQLTNPELPLGSAEQFLLSLASITELAARLKLWLFKSDYENMEKEVAEPLMDLKQGIEILQSNATFRAILATLLAVGNFLNGAEIKGFQVDYLAKVPEVKDTVHKHSLLHHLCHMIMEQNPETTDLYSEIGAVTRASRVDFDELAANLSKMEEDCKASWDHLRAIAKHDGNTAMKLKMSEFLTDCAERIMVSSIIHRRVLNRFRKFLIWLGSPPAAIRDTKPGTFCRIVSEFALEYRTTRDRVLQQLEKKANHRERNKTRGKMITQINNGYSSLGHEPLSYRTKEDRADAELRQLLGSDISDTESMRTGTWGRSRKPVNHKALGRSTSTRDDYLTDTVTDGDDEILESLVKTATRTPAPRERKRGNRPHSTQAERSSARTRKYGLSEEDRKYLILLATQVVAA